MLRWALIFLVVAVIAGAMGFSGTAGASMGAAKILFAVALAVFVFLTLTTVSVGKRITRS